MNEQEMKSHLAAIYAAQRKPSADNCRCPRCGRPHGVEYNTVRNMSHHEYVYVCPTCYTEEQILKTPIPLNCWWEFRTLAAGGELPERYNPATRETPSMKAIELMFSDDNPDGIWATFECWFDVQKKFDIDTTKFPRFEYINLYAFYDVFSGELTMSYTIVSDGDPDVSFQYVPTPTERLRIIANMEAECQEKDECTMAALVLRRKAEETTTESGPFVLLEICERDIFMPKCYPTKADAFKVAIEKLSEDIDVPIQMIKQECINYYEDDEAAKMCFDPLFKCIEEENPEDAYEDEEDDFLGFNDSYGISSDGSNIWSSAHNANTDWFIIDTSSIDMSAMAEEVPEC